MSLGRALLGEKGQVEDNLWLDGQVCGIRNRAFVLGRAC
jgi:hypothetical protein